MGSNPIKGHVGTIRVRAACRCRGRQGRAGVNDLIRRPGDRTTGIDTSTKGGTHDQNRLSTDPWRSDPVRLVRWGGLGRPSRRLKRGSAGRRRPAALPGLRGARPGTRSRPGARYGGIKAARVEPITDPKSPRSPWSPRYSAIDEACSLYPWRHSRVAHRRRLSVHRRALASRDDPKRVVGNGPCSARPSTSRIPPRW
jgi:hypothetical protein